MQPRFRVVVAGAPGDRPGDGAGDGAGEGVRDRAVAAVHAMRDAGFEVIHLGSLDVAAQMAEVVLQEDADAVGLIVCSPRDHRRVSELDVALAERGLGEVPVFVLDLTPDESRVAAITDAQVFTGDGGCTALVDWLSSAVVRGDGQVVG